MKSKDSKEKMRSIYEQCVAEGNTSLQQIAECLNNEKWDLTRGKTWTAARVKKLEKQLQVSRQSSKVKSMGIKKDNVIEAADKFSKKEEIWIPN